MPDHGGKIITPYHLQGDSAKSQSSNRGGSGRLDIEVHQNEGRVVTVMSSGYYFSIDPDSAEQLGRRMIDVAEQCRRKIRPMAMLDKDQFST